MSALVQVALQVCCSAVLLFWVVCCELRSLASCGVHRVTVSLLAQALYIVNKHTALPSALVGCTIGSMPEKPGLLPVRALRRLIAAERA
jgi:hypothetical protein